MAKADANFPAAQAEAGTVFEKQQSAISSQSLSWMLTVE
jgi:hypothetical protein